MPTIHSKKKNSEMSCRTTRGTLHNKKTALCKSIPELNHFSDNLNKLIWEEYFSSSQTPWYKYVFPTGKFPLNGINYVEMLIAMFITSHLESWIKIFCKKTIYSNVIQGLNLFDQLRRLYKLLYHQQIWRLGSSRVDPLLSSWLSWQDLAKFFLHLGNHGSHGKILIKILLR